MTLKSALAALLDDPTLPPMARQLFEQAIAEGEEFTVPVQESPVERPDEPDAEAS